MYKSSIRNLIVLTVSTYVFYVNYQIVFVVNVWSQLCVRMRRKTTQFAKPTNIWHRFTRSVVAWL